MKKYLPFILLGVGVLILALVIILLVVKNKKKVEEEPAAVLIEVPLEKRPITSLTPSADGHWLTLKIDNIVIESPMMDYELLYNLPDGRTSGVPGTITLNGQKSIERKLLLGSESSGKYRYDEGVKEGTLTLRFRNDAGKLMAKFNTSFTLVSENKNLSSVDGIFSFSFKNAPKKAFFVVMETFGLPGQAGLPDDYQNQILSGPYGIFSNDATSKGSPTLTKGMPYKLENGEWKDISKGTTTASGFYLGLSSNE